MTKGPNHKAGWDEHASGQLEFDLGAPAANLASSLSPLFPTSTKGTLPFDPAERGYRGFQSEREEATERIEQRFGLILNKTVRIRLFDGTEEICGKLILVDPIPNEESGRDLRLQIAGIEISAADIESCALIP